MGTNFMNFIALLLSVTALFVGFLSFRNSKLILINNISIKKASDIEKHLTKTGGLDFNEIIPFSQTLTKMTNFILLYKSISWIGQFSIVSNRKAATFFLLSLPSEMRWDLLKISNGKENIDFVIRNLTSSNEDVAEHNYKILKNQMQMILEFLKKSPVFDPKL